MPDQEPGGHSGEQLPHLHPEAVGPVEDLHRTGLLTVKGYRIEVYLPKDNSQAQHWTIHIFNEATGEPIGSETLALLYALGPEVHEEDRANLSGRLEILISELPRFETAN